MSLDIDNIIKQVLAKVKVKDIEYDESNSNSTYKSEPIIKTAKDIDVALPYKYKEMRNIAKKMASYSEDYNANLFYEQGKFMESHEDNFQFTGEFNCYYPTYQSMNDNQLRGYFTWRTKVRKGIIEKTSSSFAFLYIYELLNNIGVNSPLDGFEKLTSFWNAYKEYEPKIDRYLSTWIKDYIVYYDLDPLLLSAVVKGNASFYLEILFNYKNYSPSELTTSLNYFSSYNLLNSSFYKNKSTDVNMVVYKVFEELTDYYKKHRKNSFFSKLFGSLSTRHYFIFENAIFLRRYTKIERVKMLNSCEKFKTKNGYWQHDYYHKARQRNKSIGEILKIIDCKMRQASNFPYHLTLGKTTKYYNNIIEKVVDIYCLENNLVGQSLFSSTKVKEKKNDEALLPPPVIIDTTKFNEIRLAAEITQKKLIIDEEPTVELEIELEPQSSNQILDEIETSIVVALLCDDMGRVNNILKLNGLMLTVVIESINEKLFDDIGDTAIEFYGDDPIVVEDYRDQLKGIMKL